MHRFFIDNRSLLGNRFSSKEKELCHQVSKVLKMSAGKKIILCDNSEQETHAEWTIVSKSLCEAKILSKTQKPDISSQRKLHLFVSPLKNQNRWELILEKGTEIGVASFTPLITERTEVKELRKQDRLERIIKEAAEQSGRTLLPHLNEPISFSEIYSNRDKQDHRLSTIDLLPTLHEKNQSIRKTISTLDTRPMTINLYIGPEGGFTEAETKEAIKNSFQTVTLGPQILRTETAAIVSSALILNNEM